MHNPQKPASQLRPQDSSARPDLELSVVIPTHGRTEKLVKLLDLIEQQTLSRDRFECFVVDDGSPDPVTVDSTRYSFSLTLMRCEQGGPGHARNQALPYSRGRYTLYLNDDAVPALDLLEQHLAAHARSPEKTVVLGTFPFTAEAMKSTFVQVLAVTDLLFTFTRLPADQDLDWRYFWTCNLSVSTEGLRQVDGFDSELFTEPIVEDVEIGYRLEQQGFTVRHFPSCKAEHDHRLEPAGYFDRMERLGYFLTRMWAKHNDPTVLWSPSDEHLERLVFESLDGGERNLRAVESTIQALECIENEAAGRRLDAATIERVRSIVATVGLGPWQHGIHHAITGVDARALAKSGAPKGKLTTIVMVSYNALATTQDCIDSLRRTADPAYPTELIVVDNGSTDGSAEWLSSQPDVRLIANSDNVGAPAARNQALAQGYGDYVCFIDNDIVVTRGWLERAQYHAMADPRVGCVCFVAQRASKDQIVEYDGDGSEAQLEAFSTERLVDYYRLGQETSLFASFGVLVTSAVIDSIGGFDAAFSPWGFEDDDFAMRSLRAGFRNRVALDVFVYHAPYLDSGKQKKHVDHLHANWETFSRKWGSPDAEVPEIFDYDALELAESETHPEVDLYCPLVAPAQEPSPAPAAADRAPAADAHPASMPTSPREGPVQRAIASLQSLDLEAIEQCGPGGPELAALAAEQLNQLLSPPAPADAVQTPEPMALRTEAQKRVLAWPRYDVDAELETLLSEYGPILCTGASVCLCLRHDPAVDVPLEDAIERLQSVYARILGDRELEVLLVDDHLGQDQLPALGQAVLATIELTPEDPRRNAFLRGTGAPHVNSAGALASTI